MTAAIKRSLAIAPKTQGIKYAGSKLELLPYIVSLLDGLGVKSVFDGFSGTTRVSQALAQRGCRVFCNDLADWSYVLGVCYLKNKQEPSYYQELIDHLNSLEGREGWFSKHYGGLDNDGSALQRDGRKKPWQLHNTRRLDAIREEIDALALPEIDRCVALASLILALDEVDNTLGHFASYLKRWSPRSYKNMKLKVPRVLKNVQDNAVLQQDVFDAAQQVRADLSYFDPPYGSNNEKMPPSRVRYASYYHVWTSIIKNDKPPLFGKALRRQDSSDVVAASVFEEFRKDESGNFIVIQAIDRLIEQAQSRYVALSYSSGGRATASELNEVLNRHGTLMKTVEVDHKRNVMAEMRWTHQWLRDSREPNREFIFLIEK